jgi:spermidine/putrescine transport system permease protein
MPGIVTSLILTFTLSIDDFTISYFTAGSSASTLAITIYNMARKGVSPQINALSSILFLVVLLLWWSSTSVLPETTTGKSKKNTEEVLTR